MAAYWIRGRDDLPPIWARSRTAAYGGTGPRADYPLHDNRRREADICSSQSLNSLRHRGALSKNLKHAVDGSAGCPVAGPDRGDPVEPGVRR